MGQTAKLVCLCFGIWACLLVVLSILWYLPHFSGHFSFFDDSREWLQLDKTGHFFASFQVSRWFTSILKSASIEDATARKVGVWGGLIFVSPIEILDGFSHAYGFSVYDLVANACGCLALYVQWKLCTKIPFLPKFSFHPTLFSNLRPDMLGTTWLENLVKDYNGQTYWLSVDINSLVGRKIMPSWLTFAVGYGGENLLGGHDNSWITETGERAGYDDLKRYRQFYLSLDINHIGIRGDGWLSRHARTVFSVIKLPFPTVEFSAEEGIKWHWVYF